MQNAYQPCVYTHESTVASPESCACVIMCIRGLNPVCLGLSASSYVFVYASVCVSACVSVCVT